MRITAIRQECEPRRVEHMAAGAASVASSSHLTHPIAAAVFLPSTASTYPVTLHEESGAEMYCDFTGFARKAGATSDGWADCGEYASIPISIGEPLRGVCSLLFKPVQHAPACPHCVSCVTPFSAPWEENYTLSKKNKKNHTHTQLATSSSG